MRRGSGQSRRVRADLKLSTVLAHAALSSTVRRSNHELFLQRMSFYIAGFSGFWFENSLSGLCRIFYNIRTFTIWVGLRNIFAFISQVHV